MKKMPLVERVFRKIIHCNPYVERWFLYRNPRSYWTKRGGDQYFGEQEAVEERTIRSHFIAAKVAALSVRGLFLEVGCGYGKQLRQLSESGLRLSGVDFSRPQLLKSREYLQDIRVPVAEGDASALPFRDKSFEASLSSAVILHNEAPKARRILSEMIRVTRRFLIHNEDTDISFSRYGYDLTATYRNLGFQVLESCLIPGTLEPHNTQFTIVRIPEEGMRFSPEEIRLAYRAS